MTSHRASTGRYDPAMSWNWWLKSDAGLLTRVVIGSAIFLILAGLDLARNGRKATRWREYLYLVAAVVVAMVYGVINDAIAAGISWEYFFYGKGLSEQLGGKAPPDANVIRWAAIGVGLRATWSAGLIAGVVLLIANNPRPGKRRLSYKAMVGLLAVVFAVAGAFACAGAFAGRAGWLTWTNPDIAAIVKENMFRPREFLTVYGINLGGYAGGIL